MTPQFCIVQKICIGRRIFLLNTFFLTEIYILNGFIFFLHQCPNMRNSREREKKKRNEIATHQGVIYSSLRMWYTFSRSQIFHTLDFRLNILNVLLKYCTEKLMAFSGHICRTYEYIIAETQPIIY